MANAVPIQVGAHVLEASRASPAQDCQNEIALLQFEMGARTLNLEFMQQSFESFACGLPSIVFCKVWAGMSIGEIAFRSFVLLSMMMNVQSSGQSNDIFRGSFSAGAGNGGWFKVLDWNIRYGLQMEEISEAIKRERPDIVLLQEADMNARRTKRRNVAEELSRTLSLNYVFGIEFEELAQRSRSGPAYTGQAILSRFPIQSARILRFTHQSNDWRPRWYLPRWPVFQPRRRGRMALIAAIRAGAGTVVFYDVHLESQGSERLRLQQLDEVLADAAQYPRDECLVLAGDLNTDIRRSPLGRSLDRAGFRNVITEGSVSTTPEGAAKDWMFVRGPVESDRGTVHHDITGSDHFPVTSYLSVSCREWQEK